MGTKKKAATAAKAHSPAPAAPPAHSHAWLFELEFLPFNGRQMLADALTSVLKGYGKPWNTVTYAKYALHSVPELLLPAILQHVGTGKIKMDKLLTDLQTEFSNQLAAKAAAVRPGCLELLQAAKKAHIALVAVSILPEEQAATLLRKAGLDGLGIRLFSFTTHEKAFPRVDTWLRASKHLAVSPRQCLVLASGMPAAKSALAAGMRCVATPDMFTAGQDFSGVELCLDALNETKPAVLLAELYPK